MPKKKTGMNTLVVGASVKTERYSNKAIRMLLDYGHQVMALGAREGQVEHIQIKKGSPSFSDVHTVTMYLGPKNQINIYDYIINLMPKRIIFNPGTENREFMRMAQQKGIEVEEACTLVLLSTNQY